MYKKSSEEKISVVIPTYNRYSYLKQLITSIFEQSYNNIELIVINDNSTDNTDKYMLKLEKENSNIKYIKNEENRGPSYSRRIGYEKAEGEYIIFADDDDYYIDNNFFEKVVILYRKEKFKNVALISGNVKRLEEEKKKFIDADLGIDGYINGIEYLRQLQLKYQKPYSTFTTIFKKDALIRVNFENVNMINDSIIYMRALMAGDIYIMKDVIGVYREHGQNISKALPLEFLIENIDEKRKIYKILELKNKKGRWCEWYIDQIQSTVGYFLFFTKPTRQEFDKMCEWCIESLDKKKWKLKIQLFKYRKQIKLLQTQKES